MKNKLRLATFVLCGLLLLILGVQTYRLHKEQNAHETTRLQHQKVMLGLQAEAQSEKEKVLQHVYDELKEKNENIHRLQTEVERFADIAVESDRVQHNLRARLRQAELAAATGSCADAKEAARVCSVLSGKLEARARALEHRAGIYARYADRLEVELNACSAISQSVLK